MIRRLLALALLVGATVVALGVAPASAACTKPAIPMSKRPAHADDVFTGTITHRSRSEDTLTFSVAVDTVYQGSVSTQKVAVTAPRKRADCGQPELTSGSKYVFFVTEKAGELMTDSRSGTAPATPAYVARVEKLLGKGRPAVAPEPAPQKATFTTVASPPAHLRRVAAPGAALVIVGLLGLALASWRGRRRTS